MTNCAFLSSGKRPSATGDIYFNGGCQEHRAIAIPYQYPPKLQTTFFPSEMNFSGPALYQVHNFTGVLSASIICALLRERRALHPSQPFSPSSSVEEERNEICKRLFRVMYGRNVEGAKMYSVDGMRSAQNNGGKTGGYACLYSRPRECDQIKTAEWG